MHKVKSFARSKAHAHGFNPWSNEAGQQTPGAVELSQSQSSTTAAARRGSTAAGPSSDPNDLLNVVSEPTGRRKASPDTRRSSAISRKSRKEPKEPEIITAPTIDTINTERSVHFTTSDGRNNTENVGEPPDNPQEGKEQSLLKRFNKTFFQILFHSWINILLVFVPIGIAVEIAHLDPTIVFAMNCIALVPLAGMLSYATESVAHRLGDTIGALMNVTFGNAVELIVFIALAKDEISVVQASIIGSILSNLLLILGMSFLLGGLRFREQIYNSTVTQMSACLLSISALSLLLPTAFHASFSNADLADIATLRISRGTSVILLLIYIIYLLFQLRSHAYLYASIPQHVIDEESHPGILHHLGSSSSSSSSSSRRSSMSSSSSSSSGGFARSIRDRIRRMSHPDQEGRNSTRSSAASHPSHPSHPSSPEHDIERRGRPIFTSEKPALPSFSYSNTAGQDVAIFDGEERQQNADGPSDHGNQESREENPELTKAKHSLRAMAPKLFSRSGASPSPTPIAIAPGLVAEQIRPLARRATSLPPRLTEEVSARDMLPYMIPLNVSDDSLDDSKEKQVISRTSAIILLLGSTGLVAVCAEFMVSSIDSVIISTGISEAFVGLILLPIVGNAAEHVTAVTVAAKNKMDLAIGVAVGSSIQIALFVTPLVVLLGWILDKDMGLYFNIFETVALFTSCFVVNFLVLDGRSNYLEGALLCASYIIIAVAAFFYPNDEQRSPIGAGPN
ncbi:hypothetical protein TWF106_002966 [Orbilia oligospora]|uniref:Sodium/calcium exchanger membrane region domain-containing protein n=1 Tax=Orbilia oligospora TaxID=2813651 RepID=A0A6G1MBB8_ORBOL|nr:hypothetical protein TWF788_005216 [Orbilia oligospora]KAF3223096.1 hypothetical protein TWF679_004292 [Orbilia oligospora]KAF3225086.1 hypothetical protein TWF106_002966 [Orbilia oligospora]KAF3226389.1 hypothetical protein TWF191_004651 [Orbilia oligospora]KAF3252562.1 hypothetical protein TWF192_004364 [Orbilia oligospora]